MTNTTKETERAELHKTIWRIANDLRGSVDGRDFKTYVLGMLFYRFISDWLRNRNTVEFLGIWEQVNNSDFNYGGFATIKNQYYRDRLLSFKEAT